MLNSLPIRLLWHSLSWLVRLAIVTTAALAILGALAILMLRYWLLPNVELYHDQIVASLSGAIGNPVTIGRIDGDWQGLQPHLGFADVHILDEKHQTALVLPRIDGSLSWTSLLFAELRLSSLEIDRPELLVHRDAQGKIYIGGVALSNGSGDNDLANWLLHQPRMVVRDAIIVWSDEQRRAPLLALQHVNLRIENLFSRHRFAFRAAPPNDLATPLDVRGDFYGRSFDQLGAWNGQMFAQIDYTDVTSWRPWLDLPGQFSRGRGALRGWLDIANGRVTGITTDMSLRDVVTRLAENVPEMMLLNLRGRIAWKETAGDMEVSTNHLTMRLQNGIALQPTDFYFHSNKQAALNEIRANQLQLESLAGIANFLPLGDEPRSQLAAFAPRGMVSNLNLQWQGVPGKQDNFKKYRIKGKFTNLGLRKVGELPGFSGLSVDVDGNEASGKLNINSRQVAFDAPGIMREALYFSTLTGHAGWQNKDGELLVSVDKLAVVNDDLTGNVYGSYQTKTGTRGLLDLNVNLTRGDVRYAARYTPLVAVDKGGNDWLHDALLAGITHDLRIRIKGNLSDFPLKDTDGILEISGHARDVVLEFGRSWPRIENISGELLIRGNRLEVKAPSATTLGAHLQNVTVTLPDMMSSDLPLEVKGEAMAASNILLQYIQNSPVRGYIDGFTDGMSASGNGYLNLFLHVPLQGDKPVKVSGALRVENNDIDLGKDAPLLRNTRGELKFTESGMQASGVSAEILGGMANINVETAAGGTVHATVSGRNNLDELRKLNCHQLLNYLYGGAAWDADVTVANKTARLVINSNLQGLGSNLPKPFFKPGNDVLPLRLEKRNIAEGQDVIIVQLGKLLRARLVRQDVNGVSVIKRGFINFGGEGGSGARGRRADSQISDASQTPRSNSSVERRAGVRLEGSIAELSMQGWGELLNMGGAGGFAISGANIHIGRLNGFGTNIDGLSVDATRHGEGMSVQLSSSALDGDVDWQPRGAGKLTVHLQNLLWKSDGDMFDASQADQNATMSLDNLPVLQVSIDNLQMEGKQIGKLELEGHPEGKDWQIRRFNIVNPDGSISGDGVWRGAQNRTQLNLLLQISDAGKILNRSGYPNAVKGGSGKLAANMSWVGNPKDFNYATLDGTLKLDTNNGQFLKMDPGIGKLLSILSLQALPKRITLDFADVFSEGFQFNNINCNATIRHGVMDTQDFRIDGSAAKVTMKGSVDLNNETQNLHVQILPALGESVSVLGGFAAGPAVGIGSLIINKILGNPLDKLVSFEYNISGTWGDPKVVKVGETTVKPDQTK